MTRPLAPGVLLVSAAMLCACAHQGDGSQAARDKSYQPRDEDRMAQDQDEQRCQELSPSAGDTASGRSLAITDCDMQAVDQAVTGQSGSLDRTDSRRSPTDRPDNNVQRLPTVRRLGL